MSAIIRTRLSRKDLIGCLRLVPFPRVAAGDDLIGWRLGEDKTLSGQIVTAIIGDEGDARSVRLRCTLEPTGCEFADVFASQRARALAVSAFRLISELDAEATRTKALPEREDHHVEEQA